VREGGHPQEAEVARRYRSVLSKMRAIGGS